jgi:hypothetical protein
MLARELISLLSASDIDAEVLVALSREDGATEVYDIDDVSDLDGTVHIEISEEA